MLKPNFYDRAKRAISENQRTPFDLVGWLPDFLDAESDWPAAKQIDNAYQHGGGWRAFEGFKFNDGVEPTLTYPGDPPYHAVAWWKLPLTGERVILFDSAWTAVVQQDGSFEVARID